MSNFSTPNTARTSSTTIVYDEKKKNTIVYDEKKNTNKTVHFENTITVNEIPSYREYAPNERLSSWYTDADYLIFKNLLIGNRRCLRYDKEQRSQCIKDIQYAVLQEQCIERMYIVNNDPRAKKFDLFQQWLAEFYQNHSKPYILAAQQRAMENNDCIMMMSSSSPASPLLLLPSVLLNPTFLSTYPTRNNADNNNSESESSNRTTSTITTTPTSSIEGGCDSNSHSIAEVITPITTNTIDNNNNNNTSTSTSTNRRLTETTALSLVDGDSNIQCCKRLSSAIESSSSEKSMPSSTRKNNSSKRVRRRNSFCIL
jgi:hypothetical protein